MYSKAKIAGHPIHPMLVAFPIAFYVTACAAYLFYFSGSEIFWFRLAFVANVAGVISALVAAIPGFIDWAFGIPSGSAAKRTGFFHMILNVTALLIFAVSAWIGYSQYRLDTPTALWNVILTIVGTVLTAAAGFLGWRMIGTHHVGVDLTPEQERLDPSANEAARHP